MHNTDFEKMPIVMEKIRFQEPTIMPKNGSVKFLVNIFEGSGDFEICVGGNVKAIGKIRIPEKIENERTNLPDVIQSDEFTLEQSEIYKIFALRGYEYTGDSKGILRSNPQFTSGEVQWMNNYVLFLDSLLQFDICPHAMQLYLISGMEKITIDPLLHKEIVESIPERNIPVNRYLDLKITKSGGFEIKGKAHVFASGKHQQAKPVLEKYIFVPYKNDQPLDSDPNKAKLNALTVMLQIINENLDVNGIKVIELAEKRPANALLAPLVSDIIRNESMFTVSAM